MYTGNTTAMAIYCSGLFVGEVQLRLLECITLNETKDQDELVRNVCKPDIVHLVELKSNTVVSLHESLSIYNLAKPNPTLFRNTTIYVCMLTIDISSSVEWVND